MTTLRYNPLTYSEKLKKSGLDPEISKVIAQEQTEIVSSLLNNDMATKEDIKEILKVLSVIRNDINVIEYKMTIKFGMMMLAGVGLLTFLLKQVHI